MQSASASRSSAVIDIVVLGLPTDRNRAEAIIDILHEEKIAGAHRTRFSTDHPSSERWNDTTHLALTSACVVFCWSNATSKPDAAPLRMLGQKSLALGSAISVELDRKAKPPEMAGSTCYPLFGWRGHLRGWGRFVFGNSALKQIAIAAARKASGQDPPPPQALWSMIRTQAWVVLVGFVAILSAISTFWGFYNDQNLAKILDQKGEGEVARLHSGHSCDAIRKYLASHRNGAWVDDATVLLAKCHIIKREKFQNDEISLDIFGQTLAEARNDAKQKCERYANNMGGRLTSSNVEHFVPSGAASARCSIVGRVLVDVEVID